MTILREADALTFCLFKMINAVSPLKNIDKLSPISYFSHLQLPVDVVRKSKKYKNLLNVVLNDFYTK